MKRCLRCDFLYENDQRLCDLDGGELISLDTGTLPPPEPTEPRTATPTAKLRRKGFAVLPVAGVVFAVVLFMVYRALPDGAVPRDADQPPVTSPSAPRPAANPAPRPEATPAPAPTPAAAAAAPATPTAAANAKAIKRAHPAPDRPTAETRPAAPAKREEKAAGPEEAGRQKESKLGSILKKTGRFLKKPFKH